MKINFNQVLKQLGKDEPLLKVNTTEPFYLRDAAVEALLVPEERQTGEDKMKCYILAMKIYGAPDGVEMTIEDIAKIKQAIGKGYGALVVGQAWEMLEKGEGK